MGGGGDAGVNRHQRSLVLGNRRGRYWVLVVGGVVVLEVGGPG